MKSRSSSDEVCTVMCSKTNLVYAWILHTLSLFAYTHKKCTFVHVHDQMCMVNDVLLITILLIRSVSKKFL